MNPVDSDLEEGEILDDSPSSPYLPVQNDRKLPRRYLVHDKSTPIHKHRKNCKYAIRYHAKKLSKLKKTPKTKYYKKHHKSTCSHEKSHKLVDNCTNLGQKFSKNCNSFSTSSLISEIKGSFKNKTLNKSISHVSKSEKNPKIENIKMSSDNISVTNRENIILQPETSSCDSKNYNQPLVDISNDSLNSVKAIDNKQLIINIDDDDDDVIILDSVTPTPNSSPKSKNEESEDEEELRRIALATCAKRKIVTEASEIFIEKENSSSLPVPESSEINNEQISQTFSPMSDNYEVVDMEVDEDTEAFVEVLDSPEEKSQLFVIDTNPSGDFEKSTKQVNLSGPKIIDNSDEDLEVDVLRAELIKSLYHKKIQNKSVEQKSSNPNIYQKKRSVLPGKKNLGNYKKSNVNFYRKQLPGKQILRKTIVNKSKILRCNADNKPTLTAQSKQSSERLIIALNEDTSSEDSDNPVASIEALISDCRQNSGSSEKSDEAVAHVPKAVSCLSKAQQKEYTSLLKILAKKGKVQESSDTVQHKNGSMQSPLSDLKVIEENLMKFKAILDKKKESMASLSKEITAKKLLYMKSKLSAEHLKEKYIAAEKIRKANLIAWSKSCTDFKALKKTVSNLESQITHLHSKILK